MLSSQVLQRYSVTVVDSMFYFYELAEAPSKLLTCFYFSKRKYTDASVLII